MALTVGRIRERLQVMSTVGGSSDTKPASSSSNSRNGVALMPKVVVWAHNSHIGNAAATSRGGTTFTHNENWNLGQMVRHVTERSFSLGFDTAQGTVTALDRTAFGEDSNATKSYVLNQPLDQSSEQMFHQVCDRLDCHAFYLPLEGVTIHPQLVPVLQRRILQRYVGVRYHPESELQSHYKEASLIGQYDAMVFVNKTNALPVLNSEELQAGLKASAIGGADNKTNKYGVKRLMQEYIK